MLNDTQLEDVKTKLEGGRTLQDIVTNDYPDEKPGRVRRDLIAKYTAQVIRPIIRQAQLSQLTVEQLNDRITLMQGRIDALTALRDSKL